METTAPEMDLDKARELLSQLILYTGRTGRAVGFWEIAFSLGYTEETISSMVKTLEAHNILKRCDTSDCRGFTVDPRYVEDALHTLVAESKLVAYSASGKTYYYTPEQ